MNLCHGSGLLTAMAQRIDQKRERRRRLPSAWIMQVMAGIGRVPILQHPLEAAFGNMRCRQIVPHRQGRFRLALIAPKD